MHVYTQQLLCFLTAAVSCAMATLFLNNGLCTLCDGLNKNDQQAYIFEYLDFLQGLEKAQCYEGKLQDAMNTP